MAASSFMHCARLARVCVCLKQRVIEQTARREVGHQRAQAITSRVRYDRVLAVCPDKPTKSSPISRAAIRRRRPRARSTPTSGTRSSEPAPRVTEFDGDGEQKKAIVRSINKKIILVLAPPGRASQRAASAGYPCRRHLLETAWIQICGGPSHANRYRRVAVLVGSRMSNKSNFLPTAYGPLLPAPTACGACS